MNERRKHSSEFKAKVALEALKNQMTLSELSSKYGLNQHLVQKWKTEFLSNAHSVFEKENKRKSSDESKLIDRLYRKIGQLEMDCEFLKKKLY
jgi:transposase-like protein